MVFFFPLQAFSANPAQNFEDCICLGLQPRTFRISTILTIIACLETGSPFRIRNISYFDLSIHKEQHGPFHRLIFTGKASSPTALYYRNWRPHFDLLYSCGEVGHWARYEDHARTTTSKRLGNTPAFAIRYSALQTAMQTAQNSKILTSGLRVTRST